MLIVNTSERKWIKQTERAAILLAMEMWLFLRDNPDKTKSDFPKYTKSKLHLMQANCSCCEYYRGNCENCTLDLLCGKVYGDWSKGIDPKKNAGKFYNRLKKYYIERWA